MTNMALNPANDLSDFDDPSGSGNDSDSEDSDIDSVHRGSIDSDSDGVNPAKRTQEDSMEQLSDFVSLPRLPNNLLFTEIARNVPSSFCPSPQKFGSTFADSRLSARKQ